MKNQGREDVPYRVGRILDKVTHITSRGLIVPAVVLLVAWVLVVAVFIIGRSLFNLNWTFIEEFTVYWLILSTFFGLAYTLRTGGHVKVDVVVRLLPSKVRSILVVITNFLALIIICYLTWRGVEWLQGGIEYEIHSSFPSNVLLWPVYLIIPLGWAFLGLEMLRQLYHGVIGLIRPEESRLKQEDVSQLE